MTPRQRLVQQKHLSKHLTLSITAMKARAAPFHELTYGTWTAQLQELSVIQRKG